MIGPKSMRWQSDCRRSISAADHQKDGCEVGQYSLANAPYHD